MLSTIPPELYVRILQRLDSTDDALQGFDTPTALYGRSLQTKYRHYDEQVRKYQQTTTPAFTLHELQAAIGRPKAYKGIVNENYVHIAETFAQFYHSFPTRFAAALTLLFKDPALELNFLPETILELRTAGFEDTRAQHRVKMAFKLMPDQLIIEIKMQKTIPLLTSLKSVTRDPKLTFANKKQAVADVISAINNSKRTVDFQRLIALKYLLLGSSLFSRKLRLCINVTLIAPNNTDDFKHNIAKLRQLSNVDRELRGVRKSYEFGLDPGFEAAAQPFCDNLDQIPGIEVRTFYDYCQYRLR